MTVPGSSLLECGGPAPLWPNFRTSEALSLRSACHVRRQFPKSGREIAARLRNLPLMPLVIQRAIDPAAPKSIHRLRNDLCSFGLSASEMLVNVVDVNLHHQSRRCGSGILVPRRTRLCYLEQTVAHLEPRHAATRKRETILRALPEAEDTLEPFDRARHIGIQKRRHDVR